MYTETSREVTKRDGTHVPFDKTKIRNAIKRAADECDALSAGSLDNLTNEVVERCNGAENLTVENIQDMVEETLMAEGLSEIARRYIKYRQNKDIVRASQKTDDEILALVDCRNEEANEENSNKNPTLVSTQRDYIAGIVSKDIARRRLLPEDVVKAHDAGLIHVHDMDYTLQRLTNCCLVNLDDMLQNGTMIGGAVIEKPHSFSTACNIACQIALAVSAAQYGGQTWSYTPLAKFVDVSRQAIRKEVYEELEGTGLSINKLEEIVESRLKKEITRGIQTIQYQILTMSSCNGQSPFVSTVMYLNEAGDDEQLRHDLAMVIEEVIRQRYQGIKNEKGVWISPAFPKLLFVTEEDNIHENSKYFYLTQMAAKCSAKRLVPDYISEKKMKEYKIAKGQLPGDGDVVLPMGCVDKNEVIDYKIGDNKFVESFERAWFRLQGIFPVELQENDKDFVIYPKNTSIWDNNKKKYVAMNCMIRNHSDEWLRLTFSNGRILDCTPDHPFETTNGEVFAKDLTSDDKILVDKTSSPDANKVTMSQEKAWLLGMLLCDSNYKGHVTTSLGLDETDIADHYETAMSNVFGVKTTRKTQSRGAKGNYLDISAKPSEGRTVVSIANELVSLFGAYNKIDRQIPNNIFESNNDIKLSFLAGMIDADGYVNNNMKLCKVQIGSTNKALAIQQMLLAQSVGMDATIYRNHYSKEHSDRVRYRVEFVPTHELISKLVSGKKKVNMTNNVRTNASIAESDYCAITNRESYVTVDQFSYDVSTESEHFTVSGLYSHNCRSLLSVDKTRNGWNNLARAKNYDDKPKYYGRFNKAVVTINLPDVGLSANKNMDKFWSILDERLELCHKALLWRYEHLLGTKSNAAPILWQHGALARFKKGETIDALLEGGYSTISLGYAGIYECVMAMLGVSHTTPEGKKFAIDILKHLNDKCDAWNEDCNIGYSLYGSPIETVTYKFATALKKRFGIVEGITDHDYVTNSYHVSVREPIDAFSKLSIEGEFQKYSLAGCISYVELPSMSNNIEAVIKLIQHIYETCMYAELNTKSDYCQACGFDGEIQIIEDEHGHLDWECPRCGNRDHNTLTVCRRTCGYLGTQFWNQGRTEEIRDRVLHL